MKWSGVQRAMVASSGTLFLEPIWASMWSSTSCRVERFRRYGKRPRSSFSVRRASSAPSRMRKSSRVMSCTPSGLLSSCVKMLKSCLRLRLRSTAKLASCHLRGGFCSEESRGSGKGPSRKRAVKPKWVLGWWRFSVWPKPGSSRARSPERMTPSSRSSPVQTRTACVGCSRVHASREGSSFAGTGSRLRRASFSGPLVKVWRFLASDSVMVGEEIDIPIGVPRKDDRKSSFRAWKFNKLPDYPLASADSRLRKIPRPPVGPRRGSTARSGCGIMPSTFPRRFTMPAMPFMAPLGTWDSPISPEGEQ